MSEGREADITVLSLEEVDMDLEDCQSQMRRIKQRLLSAEVWRAGGVGGDRKTKPVSPDPERFFLRRMVDTTGSPRSIDSVMRSGSFLSLIHIWSKPGLGVEIREEIVQKYKFE